MVSCNRHFLTQKCQAGGGTVQQNIGMILELARSVTPRKKIKSFSPPPSVFASALSVSCYPLSYTLSSCCLFFSSWRDKFGFSDLILKHAQDPATSSAGCSNNKKRDSRGHGLKNWLYVGRLPVMVSHAAGFVVFLSLSLFHSTPTHPLYLFTVALRESTYWSQTEGRLDVNHPSLWQAV